MAFGELPITQYVEFWDGNTELPCTMQRFP